MKILFVLVMVHITCFAHSKTVQKLNEYGKKGSNDVRLFAQDFTAPGTFGSATTTVNFPPKCLWRLKEFYKITYLLVKDYNPSTATVQTIRGGIGKNELDIELASPGFREIDVSVEYWGTFNVEKFLATPMKSCNYKPPYTG